MSEYAVYEAICAVTEELGITGVSKTRKNQQQGYSFRGVDDFYQVLNPALAKHKLCLLPRVLGREVTERQTKSGGVLFSVTVDVEFDLVSAVDGSKHTVRTFGEAMDSADKATNKAMSAAYKYAAMMAFSIPTEGVAEDADHTTHPEIKAKSNGQTPAKEQPKEQPKTPRASAELDEIAWSWSQRIEKADGLHAFQVLWVEATALVKEDHDAWIMVKPQFIQYANLNQLKYDKQANNWVTKDEAVPA